MKKCPKCGKIYDNSWNVCLPCSTPLVSEDAEVKEAMSEYDVWKKDIGIVDTVLAKNQQEATEKGLRKYREAGINLDNFEVIKSNAPLGQFPCPQCKAYNTTAKKEMDWVWWLIPVLGIIIYLRLPYHCHCKICDYDWEIK